MAQLFNTLLYTPIVNALIFLYHGLGNSFGLAVIALTVILRAITVPLTLPALKSQKKIQELSPLLKKLKEKHSDKKQLQKAQLELYRKHGVNPAAGCLPQILQIVVLIALYRVFLNFLNGGQINGTSVNLGFLWLDLGKPDPYYLLPLAAGLSQLVYSLMLRPGTEHHDDQKKTPKTKRSRPAAAGAGGEMEMAQEIQNQMLFMMPIMTVIISLRFPSGLALYWVITTVFSLIQQWLVAGPGGLNYYFAKFKSYFPGQS